MAELAVSKGYLPPLPFPFPEAAVPALGSNYRETKQQCAKHGVRILLGCLDCLLGVRAEELEMDPESAHYSCSSQLLRDGLHLPSIWSNTA